MKMIGRCWEIVEYFIWYRIGDFDPQASFRMNFLNHEKKNTIKISGHMRTNMHLVLCEIIWIEIDVLRFLCWCCEHFRWTLWSSATTTNRKNGFFHQNNEREPEKKWNNKFCRILTNDRKRVCGTYKWHYYENRS